MSMSVTVGWVVTAVVVGLGVSLAVISSWASWRRTRNWMLSFAVGLLLSLVPETVAAVVLDGERLHEAVLVGPTSIFWQAMVALPLAVSVTLVSRSSSPSFWRLALTTAVVALCFGAMIVVLFLLVRVG